MLQMTLAAKQTITRADVPEPKAEKGQVVVKILRSGICGSDIHAYFNKHPFIQLPVVPGHEFAGTVDEIGEAVTGLNVGDRVTVMPQLYCGECRNCKIGRYNICTSLKVMGCGAPGSYQEKLAVPAELVLKLPDDMSFDQGTMLEPIAVGIGACKRTGVKGKRVLVLGAGTIGNLTAQAAKAMGAESVMITDKIDWRLEQAKKCSIEHTVNVDKSDLAAEIKKVWGDDGADLIIECIGVNVVDEAIHLARKGTDIVIVGVFSEPCTINMGLIQDKEVNLIGSLMYIEQDWHDAIKFVSDKSVVLEPLISKHFPLEKLPEAYEYAVANMGSSLKVLIES